ncbi:hypothetical protein [Catellatospora tritici]|uniref:hypothetical protein n=1 Tax=Catellatospora tritici TaxID=2851566 RepID=UPI001C2D8BBE|nr:hypothetical protein [Catellatospora tritici]MBV1856740.1 hypothetical protein [Catellatospora tritici]
MDDQTLAQALRSRIAQDEPPIGLTASRVLRAGRRARLRRRVAGAGGALGLLGVIAVATAYLLTPTGGQSAAPSLVPGCQVSGGAMINSVVQRVEFYRPEWEASFPPPSAPVSGTCPVPDSSPAAYPLHCPAGLNSDSDLLARAKLTCFLREQLAVLDPDAEPGPLQGPEGGNPLYAYPRMNGGYEASAVLADRDGAGGLVVTVTTMSEFEQAPSPAQCATVGCERRADRDGMALAVFHLGGPGGGFEALTVYAYRDGVVVALTSTNDDRAYGGPFRSAPTFTEEQLTTLALALLETDVTHAP